MLASHRPWGRSPACRPATIRHTGLRSLHLVRQRKPVMLHDETCELWPGMWQVGDLPYVL